MAKQYNIKDVNFTTTSKYQTTQKLQNTGDLVIMTDLNGNLPDIVAEQEADDVANSYRNYLFFRGNLIAGGIGFKDISYLNKATYMASKYDDVFNTLNELSSANRDIVDSSYAYTSYMYGDLYNKLIESQESSYSYTYTMVSELALGSLANDEIDLIYDEQITNKDSDLLV